MSQFLLVAAVALTVGAIVFGVTVLITGDERGLRPVEPDGRAIPLPAERPLVESDLPEVRFDTALRGYRMAQVDAAMQRLAYDLGYKEELIKVLLAEANALRDGRAQDAEALRRSREAALAPAIAAAGAPPESTAPPKPVEPTVDETVDEQATAVETDPASPAPAAPAQATSPEQVEPDSDQPPPAATPTESTVPGTAGQR